MQMNMVPISGYCNILKMIWCIPKSTAEWVIFKDAIAAHCWLAVARRKLNSSMLFLSRAKQMLKFYGLQMVVCKEITWLLASAMERMW